MARKGLVVLLVVVLLFSMLYGSGSISTVKTSAQTATRSHRLTSFADYRACRDGDDITIGYCHSNPHSHSYPNPYSFSNSHPPSASDAYPHRPL